MWALIAVDGRVVQLEAAPFPVAQPLEWIEAAPDITLRHHWDGRRFFLPERPGPAPDPGPDRFERLVATLVVRGGLTPADRDELTPGREPRNAQAGR